MILASALLLLPVAERLEAAPVPPARLVVERGRATVVREGAFEVRTPGSTETAVAGPGHVEVAVDSVARLAWDGRASILVTGPAALEWPGAARVELRVEALAGGSVEVRRGVARLILPGGWELDVDGGLVWIAEAPGRRFDVRRDAGVPLSLAAPDEPGWPRPPIRVGAGAHVRLGPRRAFEIVRGGPRVSLDPRALARPGHTGLVEALSTTARADLDGFQWPWNRPAEAPEEPPAASLDGPSAPAPLGPPVPRPGPIGPPAPVPVAVLEPEPEPAVDAPVAGPESPSEPPPVGRDPTARWRAWRRSLVGAVAEGGRGLAVLGVHTGTELRAAAERWVARVRRHARERELERRRLETAPSDPSGSARPEFSSEPRPGYVREVGPWGLRWRRISD